MSEPIRLWTHAGEMVVMYSPTIAHEAVMSGKLLESPPVVDVDADMPALDGMPGDDEPVPEYNAKLMSEYVERVERKVGRPRKATGQIL